MHRDQTMISKPFQFRNPLILLFVVLFIGGSFSIHKANALAKAENINSATPQAATPAIAPATITSSTEDELILKVVDKLTEAMKDITAIKAATATMQIAPATIANATKEPAILTGIDKSVDSVMDGISTSITETRHWISRALGGEDSNIAYFVDVILSFISDDFMGWAIWEYLLSFFIIFFSLCLRQWIALRLFNTFKRFSATTKTRIDDELAILFEQLLPPFRMAIALFGIYLSVMVFFHGKPPSGPAVLTQFFHFFRAVSFLALLSIVAWALCRVADVTIQWMSRMTRDQETLLDHTFIPIARRTAKIFIIIVTILQGLDYFNLDAIVNSLLAAAGVSGLAIGLAAQDTIKNFFGSIVLLVDRPFSIGDWIVAGDTEGIVESVGFRSTKIRTFGKTLITIPNSSIVDRDIDNITRRKVRRIKFTLGVSYETKPEQMEELLGRIRTLLRTDDAVWPHLILVRFTEFGDSSLNIFIYYFSKTINWDEHLAVRERMNLEIMKIINDMGLEIAFPTQTLYLRQDDTVNMEAPEDITDSDTPPDEKGKN